MLFILRHIRGHTIRFRDLIILYDLRMVIFWFALLVIETFLVWLLAFLILNYLIVINSSHNYSRILRIFIILYKVILNIYLEIRFLLVILIIDFFILIFGFIYIFLSNFFLLILWLLLNFYILWITFLNFFRIIVIYILLVIWKFTFLSLFALLRS